ncbi:type II toxin-antitoxin system PemK/MazF family toxin [Bacteroides xylanisolvens]|nr:type II toxin-antitoxin system PemK/MazF family toxin [Bacteroides xylanisolvens]
MARTSIHSHRLPRNALIICVSGLRNLTHTQQFNTSLGVTPSDLNMYLTTVVIVPITSTIRNYPYRVLCSVAGREGEIATDQIRTVDKSRIKRKIGELNNREIEELKEVFRQMFCE